MSIKKISIIFAGTPEFAVPALEKINLAGFEIKLVLTQPDRKSGRGMNIKKSPVKQKSIELDIPVYQPEVLINNKEAINKITAKKADILIAAVGVANLVKGDWVKKDSIVIDVGINKVGDQIVGDVEFDSVKEKVKAITPVPGGVGPMTIACLLKNTLECFKDR